VTNYPLPDLGLCPMCEGEIKIRKSGTLYVHGCDGDGRRPVARLRPTFARWLHSHTGRRNENWVTVLAHYLFVGCTRSPRRTPVDVFWTTSDELHEHVHHITPVRQPYNGQRCDWLCRDIQRAAAIYADLLADVAGDAS
jgi:hypothetical protein